MSACRFRQLKLIVACSLLTVSSTAGSMAVAIELQGYTEPFRTVDVASDEMGTVAEVFAHEGQVVTAEQPLAELNSQVYLALLAVAEQNMKSEGRLEAALADYSMRQDRLSKLLPLLPEGYARQEEVDRASAEVSIAEANVRTAREEIAARNLEYEKIKVQIARRTIRAPISGIITVIQKEAGEFVAPNDPVIAQIVQVDQLLANFTLMDFQSEALELGQQVEVEFTSGKKTPGSVSYISPVTNAESGTILIKIRIDNAQGRFRSGDRCKIQLQD